jgi:hypothetical protein
VIASRAALVGCDHEQLAEAPRRLARRQASHRPPFGPKLARCREGLLQQLAGKARAKRREQGRTRGLGRVWRCKPMGSQAHRLGRHSAALEPTGLSVEGAEGDGQHGALGQRLRA